MNECSELEVNPCTESTYCSNTVGSFKCLRKCLTDFVGHCRKKVVSARLFQLLCNHS